MSVRVRLRETGERVAAVVCVCLLRPSVCRHAISRIAGNDLGQRLRGIDSINSAQPQEKNTRDQQPSEAAKRGRGLPSISDGPKGKGGGEEGEGEGVKARTRELGRAVVTSSSHVDFVIAENPGPHDMAGPKLTPSLSGDGKVLSN